MGKAKRRCCMVTGETEKSAWTRNNQGICVEDCASSFRPVVCIVKRNVMNRCKRSARDSTRCVLLERRRDGFEDLCMLGMAGKFEN